jgi:hypothetical protein
MIGDGEDGNDADGDDADGNDDGDYDSDAIAMNRNSSGLP